MGSYLIPGAMTVSECAAHLQFIPPPRRTFTLQPGGVYFADPFLTDAECATLFADFTPTQTSEDHYATPVPQVVSDAVDTLQAIYQANPPAMTAQQTAQAFRAVMVVLRWMNRRLVEEGG